MSRFAKIIATNEDLTEMEVELDTNQGAQQATEAVIDVQADAEIVDNFDGGLDQAQNAVANIDELSENLQQMQDNGGITEFAEKTAQVALESIMASLGLSHEVPSMESLTSKNIIATLEEKSESLLSRVITGVKSAMDAIVSFIQGLLRNRSALIKYLEGLRQKLGGIQDESSVNFDKDSKYFNTPQQALEAITTADKCIDFAEGITFYLKEVEKSVSTGDTSVDPNVADAKQKPSSIAQERVETAKEIISKETGKVFGTQEGDIGAVAGGKKLVVAKKEGGVEFQVKDGSLDKNKAKPDLSDLSEIINKALVQANKLKKLEKVDGAIKTFMKNFLTNFQKSTIRVANRNNTDDRSKEESLIHRLAMVTLTNMRKAARQYGTMMPTIAFKNLKACGDYVKQYIG